MHATQTGSAGPERTLAVDEPGRKLRSGQRIFSFGRCRLASETLDHVRQAPGRGRGPRLQAGGPTRRPGDSCTLTQPVPPDAERFFRSAPFQTRQGTARRADRRGLASGRRAYRKFLGLPGRQGRGAGWGVLGLALLSASNPIRLPRSPDEARDQAPHSARDQALKSLPRVGEGSRGYFRSARGSPLHPSPATSPLPYRPLPFPLRSRHGVSQG